MCFAVHTEKIIHSFSHSFDTSLLSIYYVPAPVLNTGGTGVKKTAAAYLGLSF